MGFITVLLQHPETGRWRQEKRQLVFCVFSGRLRESCLSCRIWFDAIFSRRWRSVRTFGSGVKKNSHRLRMLFTVLRSWC